MPQTALNLSIEAARALRQALAEFCREADVRYAAILQDAGMLIADCGDESHRDQGEIGAIATGAFFAAQALAQRLGEPEFSGLHYEGSQRHFFLAPLTREFLLLCVFANETRIGVVRTCVSQAGPVLKARLDALTEAPLELGDLTLTNGADRAPVPFVPSDLPVRRA
jgi:predicted regulator of Ras-like GTPase activity (Roadblock/LC7/MglB family)